MRNTIAILAVGLVLAGCGQQQPAQAADPTVESLQAEAAQAEAQAARLEAEALRAPPARAAAPANAAGGSPLALAAGDEKLKTGQYYDTISFDAQIGQIFNIVYDTQGYQPDLIVLGPDNKPDSESEGPAPDAKTGASHVENETTADRAGTWHVLLSSVVPGATGAYRVRVEKVTRTR